MTKADFITLMANEGGLSKKDAASAVDAFIGAVTKVLVDGDSVSLIGFGTFSTQYRNARKARVPNTGEQIDVPETVVAKFKPGTLLKDSVAATVSKVKPKKSCCKK